MTTTTQTLRLPYDYKARWSGVAKRASMLQDLGFPIDATVELLEYDAPRLDGTVPTTTTSKLEGPLVKITYESGDDDVELRSTDPTTYDSSPLPDTSGIEQPTVQPDVE